MKERVGVADTNVSDGDARKSN